MPDQLGSQVRFRCGQFSATPVDKDRKLTRRGWTLEKTVTDLLARENALSADLRMRHLLRPGLRG